jgi:hypothetical protein
MTEVSMGPREPSAAVEELPRSLMSRTIKMKKGSEGKKLEKAAWNVEAHPEYYRVDHEVCHRLFEWYKQQPLG